MKTRISSHSFSVGVLWTVLVLNSGCGLYSGSAPSQEAVLPSLALQFTAPVSDLTISSASYDFIWTDLSSVARAVNPYQINVYSQANCAGSAISTAFTSTNHFLLSGLLDSSARSVGVSVFSAAGISSPEVCSRSILGTALVARLSNPGGVSLSLDIDPTNQMAYLGSNQAGVLFNAVDLSQDANPLLFTTIGAASTPSTATTYIRGTALYKNGQRLLTASNNGSLELWDLTATPRAGGWTKLGNLGGLPNAKKIAKVNTSNPAQTVVTVVLRFGFAIVNIAEPAGTMTLGSIYGGFGQRLDSGTILGNWMLSGSSTIDNAYLLNLTTNAVDATYVLNPGNTQYLWSSTSSADSKKAFVGGVANSFFSYDPTTPAVVPVMTGKYTSVTGALTRDAVFVVENGKDLLYTIGNTGYIGVWDLSNISLPVLIKSQLIPGYLTAVSGEAYAIRVNPATRRAYVSTTSNGDFFVLNTDMLTAPASQPVTY